MATGSHEGHGQPGDMELSAYGTAIRSARSLGHGKSPGVRVPGSLCARDLGSGPGACACLRWCTCARERGAHSHWPCSSTPMHQRQLQQPGERDIPPLSVLLERLISYMWYDMA